MDNKDLFAALEAEVQKMKERKPKKEKVVIKPSPPTPQPWDELPDYLKVRFDRIVQSECESEARKDKGRPKSGHQIKLDAYQTVQHSIKQFEQSTVITDDSLALAFNHYTNGQLTELVLSGKKYFRLSDRTLSNECIEKIAREDDAEDGIVQQVFNAVAAKDIELAHKLHSDYLYRITHALICEIEQDYQDLLTGA